MSTATDKFICYRPGLETEADGKEVWASYAREAAREYFDTHIDGYEATDEYEGLHIRVRHVDTQADYDFQVEVNMCPVYYFNEID